MNDQSLTEANFMWSDILKNPSQSDSKFRVDLHFPHPLPMTGCVGFVFGGGPLVQGEVTMSADLNLTYEPSNSEANAVIDLSGEYCFGQNWGCQNATVDDEMGFVVPITMPAGHMVELFGNISDSTFDGKAFVDLSSTCVKPLPNRDEPVMAAKDLCAFSRLLADGVSHWLDSVRHLPNPSAVPAHLV